MTISGETLRTFRQAGNDPDRFNRRLTQQRLGKLMGKEMGDFGFSGLPSAIGNVGKAKSARGNFGNVSIQKKSLISDQLNHLQNFKPTAR